LTEAAQIADRWKGYCEDLYCDEEGKEIVGMVSVVYDGIPYQVKQRAGDRDITA